MKKLLIIIVVLILAGLSIVALFYPDNRDSIDKNCFTGTIVFEMVNNDGSRIEDFNNNALAKEAINNAVNQINNSFLSRTLYQIGYDNVINLKETVNGIRISKKQQYLIISVINSDGIYVDKMTNCLGVRLTETSGCAPYFRFIIEKSIEIERQPTIGTFLNRQMGEEITVGVFVIIWISILGIILMYEIKQSENKNGGK